MKDGAGGAPYINFAFPYSMMKVTTILITAACLCIGLTPVSASAPQSQKSETIVYIGGEKFYIHTVQPGQTLYSIARLYGVSEQTLVAYNPTMADVLKADQNVKIPVPAPQMQPDEAPLTARQEKKLRKKFILHTVQHPCLLQDQNYNHTHGCSHNS